MSATLEIPGGEIPLGRVNLIGTGAMCGVRLSDRRVGHAHALLSWRAEGWRVIDLHSKNGTRVGDQTVPSGGQVTVDAGATLVFGGRDGVRCRLTHAGPPSLFACHLETGAFVTAPDILSLPTPDGSVDVFRVEGWFADVDGTRRAVEDGQVLLGWRLSLPGGRGTEVAAWRLQDVTLYLRRSTDTVRASLETPGRTIDLGQRSHWRYGWELALARVARGPDGWVDHLVAAREVGVHPNSLSQFASLIRTDLAQAGVLDAGDAVESERYRRRFSWDRLVIDDE